MVSVSCCRRVPKAKTNFARTACTCTIASPLFTNISSGLDARVIYQPRSGGGGVLKSAAKFSAEQREFVLTRLSTLMQRFHYVGRPGPTISRRTLFDERHQVLTCPSVACTSAATCAPTCSPAATCAPTGSPATTCPLEDNDDFICRWNAQAMQMALHERECFPSEKDYVQRAASCSLDMDSISWKVGNMERMESIKRRVTYQNNAL